MLMGDKRITIMMNPRLDGKVSSLQAEMIKKSSSTVSYFKVIGELVAKGLKKH